MFFIQMVRRDIEEPGNAFKAAIRPSLFSRDSQEWFFEKQILSSVS